MGCYCRELCGVDPVQQLGGLKVITCQVWVRWEDTKKVTTEMIKSLIPLFEGDQIIVDDKVVTIVCIEYSYRE